MKNIIKFKRAPELDNKDHELAKYLRARGWVGTWYPLNKSKDFDTKAFVKGTPEEIHDRTGTCIARVVYSNKGSTYKVLVPLTESTLLVEYTDLFGGEANYSWVERKEIVVDDDASDRVVVTRAKAALGISGTPCRRTVYGDTIELRPVGSCTIVFITPVY